MIVLDLFHKNCIITGLFSSFSYRFLNGNHICSK